MTKADLKSMSRKELEKLNRDIEKALSRAKAKEIKVAKTAIEKALKARGFSLADVIDGGTRTLGPKKKSAVKTVAPKYANPAEPGQTWSGRGRKPNWYKAALEAGKLPADMSI